MRKTTRVVPAMLVIAALTACGGAKEAATDSTGSAMAPAAMAAAKTPASFAGTWSTTATLEGVANPVPSTLTGSADGATWNIALEGRPNVAAMASMSGDSLVIQSAEYESILRKGVMVTTRTASVMTDSVTMAGNMTATYKTAAGSEVVKGTLTSTRKP